MQSEHLSPPRSPGPEKDSGRRGPGWGERPPPPPRRPHPRPRQSRLLLSAPSLPPAASSVIRSAVVAVGRPGSPGSGRDDGGPPSGRHHLEPGLALCAVLSQQPRKEHHSQRQQKSETRMAAVPGRGARPARRLPRERPPSREPGFGDGPLPRTRSASSLRNVGAQGSALRDTGL